MKCMIYDYETLGQNPNAAPVLSVAIYAFDDNDIHEHCDITIKQIVADSVFAKFDVAEQITKYNKEIDPSTVEWWRQQSKEAQKILQPSSEDISISKLPQLFADAGSSMCERVYTRGNTFDPIFTTQICRDLNVSEPYDWWTIRDMRSLIEGMSYGSGIKNNFMPPTVNDHDVVLHDPRYDIALDVLRIATLS